MKTITKRAIAVGLLGVLIGGCATIPPDVLQLPPTAREDRERQSRVYETTDEARLLAACTAVLQDLGFTIDRSESRLGMLTGSTTRDATNGVEVLFALLAALNGKQLAIDQHQTIRVSVVTWPRDQTRTTVRVTAQLVVVRTDGTTSKAEPITDPVWYQTFFSKLSKAVFLEAHAL